MKQITCYGKHERPGSPHHGCIMKIAWLMLICGACLLPLTGSAYDSLADRLFDPRLPATTIGAGALAGSQQDVAAVFGNPAFLTTLKEMQLSLGAGLLTGNHIGAVFAMAQPIPLAGKLGLGLTSITPHDPGADDPFQADEQSLIAAYGYEILPWMSVGVRFREIRTQTPTTAKSGEGLDLGFKFNYDYYWLGVAGINLLQPGIDTALEDVAYPRRVIADLGAEWPGVLRTMIEFSQDFGDNAGNRMAWGVESDFSDALTVRAGADLQAVYAGLGTMMNNWQLDYAGRYDLEQQTFAHWLSLGVHFGAYEVSLSLNSPFLTKGGRNNVVLIRVHHHRDKVFKKWIFKVINAQGYLVYQTVGKNLLPGELRWEGRNARQRMVPDGEYWAYIEGMDIEGNRLETNQVRIQVFTRRTTNFIQVK